MGYNPRDIDKKLSELPEGLVEAGEIIRVAASYRLVKSTPTATKKWLE